MKAEDIKPWLFRVEPLEGESLSHFLGRFRRANDLTVSRLGNAAGLGGAIARWEKFRFIPPPNDLQLAALAKLVRLEVEQIKLMLPQETIQNRVIRLCAACYAEGPYHRTEWQYKLANRCDRHHLLLLLECPNCKAKLRMPSKWANGICKRCLTPFDQMAELQKGG